MNDIVKRGSANLTLVLWVIVLLEFVLPVPAMLTFGAIFVLLFKPPWFPKMVRQLYDEG